MTKEKFDMSVIHTQITEGLIALMESGVAPWSKPWLIRGHADVMAPHNGTSGRRYTGFNSMYLSFLMDLYKWKDPRFYTMKGLPSGLRVTKGSKSTIVIYNKMVKRDVINDVGKKEEKVSWFQRYYRVFNGSQVDGLGEFVKPEVDVEPYMHEDEDYPEAEGLCGAWCDSLAGGLSHESDRAFYKPMTDSISMPNSDQFSTLSAYYQTLMHEMIHSTGHDSRANRIETTSFGADKYAKEELVAEFGAAFMCANTGVPLDESQSAAYLKGWAKRCKAEPKLLYSAANAAHYAANMIMECEYAIA